MCGIIDFFPRFKRLRTHIRNLTEAQARSRVKLENLGLKFNEYSEKINELNEKVNECNEKIDGCNNEIIKLHAGECSNYASAEIEVLQEKLVDIQENTIKNLVCPICLKSLYKAKDNNLFCGSCSSIFPVENGVPILLVKDENWNKKKDEISGEVEFNVKTVPLHVHEQRNAFMNKNSTDLLKAVGIKLHDDNVLAIGCSMAEANCFAPITKSMVALDIVPTLTIANKESGFKTGLCVSWVCGDGECLPFADETFDAVIIRQALHHMLKYYSAISEFFRVTKIGGHVIIIEEPYSAPDFEESLFSGLPDSYLLYGSVDIGSIRYNNGISIGEENNLADSLDINSVDFSRYEVAKDYIAPVPGDSESMLADKYHNFSALNLIFALRLHTDSFKLLWPDVIGWSKIEGDTIEFCTGPNPALKKDLLGRLTESTTFSVVATKNFHTSMLRSRVELKPVGIRP